MGIPADRIGPYPIERELGRGGMGIVYLGRDPALGRPVAVKVLPEAVAADRERLARFDREARLLAAVHHPNVASIFNVGEENGRRFLALEYVPGETLADRLTRGALPFAEALDVCRQIAAGLEAAHEAGVVHRDLKPANVRLTPDGVAKVLDFGLAKGGAIGSETAPSDSFRNSPTQTLQSTEPGMLLGTVGYMSPEQARGKPVDRRADVWALGCILYECLTGRPPFGGDTPSDVLAKILEREPAWNALPAATSPRVRELLRRCLEKDRNRRLRDVGDARLELEAADSERSSASALAVTALPPPRRRWPKVAAAGLAVATLAAAAGWWLGRGVARPATAGQRLSMIMPDDLQVDLATLSPVGDGLVVAARPRGTQDNRLYRRAPGSFELMPLPGTERVVMFSFTPTGEVHFLASKEGSTDELWQYAVPVDGSAPPTALYRWQPGWLTLMTLRDGTDLVAMDRNQSFVRIPRATHRPGPPTRFDIGTPGSVYFVTPIMVREDRWVLVRFNHASQDGYFEGTAAMEVATGKGHVVLEHGSAVALTPDGYLLFSRGTNLLAAPLDTSTLRISGPEVSLLAGLRVVETGMGSIAWLSPDGTLTYPAGGDVTGDRQLFACVPGGACEPWSPLRRRFIPRTGMSVHGNQVAAVLIGARGRFEIWRLSKEGRAD
ncbi:MAG TPA: serine/threonine-protein kinase, partial [Thermoanaerobaculia bacterium]|nr:serine/threonine-protein kinase [Thermoanaerobaculia bacterium]